MKMLLYLVVFLVLAGLSTVLAQEKSDTKKGAKPDLKEVELPPAIQEMLDKELEKLPPAERHFRKAQQLHARGNLDGAQKELNLSLEQDPENVPSNCELGVVYMGLGDYDKAISQLQKTLKLDPDYPKTYYALANAYARKPEPDVELAKKHLDDAIKLGYHPVPWFLEYVKNLENAEKGVPTTN